MFALLILLVANSNGQIGNGQNFDQYPNNLFTEVVDEPRRPCESMKSCDITDMYDKKYINLERRIRSLEQPGMLHNQSHIQIASMYVHYTYYQNSKTDKQNCVLSVEDKWREFSLVCVCRRSLSLFSRIVWSQLLATTARCYSATTNYTC